MSSEKYLDNLELLNESKINTVFIHSELIEKTFTQVLSRFKNNGFNIVVSWDMINQLGFHLGKTTFEGIENALKSIGRGTEEAIPDLSSMMSSSSGGLFDVLKRILTVSMFKAPEGATQHRILFLCKHLNLVDENRVKACLLELSSNKTIRNIKHLFCFIVPPSFSVSEELEAISGKLIRELPDRAEFKEMLEQAQTKGRKLGDNIEILLDAAKGLNMREFEEAILRSGHIHGKVKLSEITETKNIKFKKNPAIELVISKLGFDRIGGAKKLKKFFKEKVVTRFLKPELARKLGLGIVRGVVMFGPPGTGKSIFVEALSKEVDLPLVKVHLSRLFGKYVGQTETRTQEVLQLIERLSPCIVFIDEIDTAMQARGGQQHEVTSRMLGDFLTYLASEERNNCIICATNRPQDLDAAFTRAGRMDYIILVTYPELKERGEIIKVHLEVVNPVSVNEDIDYFKLAELTENYTGADIKQITVMARENALSRNSKVVNMKDVEGAIGDYWIDESEVKKQKEFYISKARTMRVIRSLLPESIDLSKIDLMKAKKVLSGEDKEASIFED